jgi:hypothetical protein
VAGDPYQLRIYVPAGYRLERVAVPAGLKAATAMNGELLTVEYTASSGDDVPWSVHFAR